MQYGLTIWLDQPLDAITDIAVAAEGAGFSADGSEGELRHLGVDLAMLKLGEGDTAATKTLIRTVAPIIEGELE